MPQGLEDILAFRPCYHLKLKCGQIRSWMLGNSMEQAGWSGMNSKESCFFEEICFYQLWFYDMHSWADGLPAGPAVFHCFGVGGVGHANLSLTHMVDATQCTCPSQPAHMVDATWCTQCNRNARVLLSPRTWWMLRKHAFVWVCTHGGCYATCASKKTCQYHL